jgi:hypothetical protein
VQVETALLREIRLRKELWASWGGRRVKAKKMIAKKRDSSILSVSVFSLYGTVSTSTILRTLIYHVTRSYDMVSTLPYPTLPTLPLDLAPLTSPPQTSLYWPSDFPTSRLPCIAPLTSLPPHFLVLALWLPYPQTSLYCTSDIPTPRLPCIGPLTSQPREFLVLYLWLPYPLTSFNFFIFCMSTVSTCTEAQFMNLQFRWGFWA